MKIYEIYSQFEERGLTLSQRHFSSVWLERGENYLSQNKDSDLLAEDGLTLWRSLRDKKEFELAAQLLTNLLEAQ